MTLNLVAANHELLSAKLPDFNFSNPPVDIEQLTLDMIESMREKNAIGLAANQVGLPYRMFVMDGEPAHACFNPRIVMPGEEQVLLEEGCVSYPGLLVKIKRPKVIKVRFTGPDGEVYTKTFTGMTARVFQHELDHLDGISHISRANSIHREQAFKKLRDSKRREKNKNTQWLRPKNTISLEF